jgi:adenylate kinase family enzyme
MSGSVLILTGPPGSGKSTVAALLAARAAQKSVHLYTDDFYDRYIKNGYVLPWLPESQAQNETVTSAVAAAAFAYARGGYFVVLDGIVGPWFVAPYRAAAKAHGIALHYAVLRADPDVAVARVTARGTHGLKAEGPVRDLNRQFAQLGPLEDHALDTTGIDAGAVADSIECGLDEGRFRLIGE